MLRLDPRVGHHAPMGSPPRPTKYSFAPLIISAPPVAASPSALPSPRLPASPLPFVATRIRTDLAGIRRYSPRIVPRKPWFRRSGRREGSARPGVGGSWGVCGAGGVIRKGSRPTEPRRRMESGNYVDSSGTDDDLPPSYQNTRGMKCGGRMSGNGRDMTRVDPYARVQPQTDMETKIHQLEQEAYCFVLRAFKAQSDAITWEKEGLITELRKELRVSDKEHRELLNRVNNDDIIRSIREWRESTGGLQMNLINNNPQRSHDPMPSPTTSARKRQKMSQRIPSASIPAPSAVHSQPLAAPMQLSSGAKKAAPSGTKGKSTKPGQKIPNVPTVKAIPIPSSAGHGGREPITKINPPGSIPSEGLPLNSLIGCKVMTRWPDDNSFYEAVITDYNPVEDRYVLVYDINTAHESWEWVDFKEMAPGDVKWEDGDPGINLHGHGGPVRGGKKSSKHVGGPDSGAGRGRGPQKNSFKKGFPPSQNGVGKKSSDYIEILHTGFLIKEVERVFSAGHPDPFEMERAKKVLKEHEQSLINAIARLAEASDGESDDRARSLDYNRGWQNQHGRRYGDDMAIDGFMTGDADAM